MQKKIIYLDRDGVINEDFGYVSKIENFKFVNGVFEACKEFLALGYEIIVVTNQSGIGRNYYSEDEFLELTKYMKNEFKKKDIDILNVYYCPHNPDDNCSCRKPKTGMILHSLTDSEITLNTSWLLGDDFRGLLCAQHGNIPNRILISEDVVDGKDFLLAKSLLDSVKYIKK